MKLIKILNNLPKKEISKFKQFLESPLFNKRKDVQDLLAAWIEVKGRHLPPTEYWSIVFPFKAFNLTQWNLLTSRLFKLLEKYLAWWDMQQNEALQKFHLAKAYRQLQQDKFVIKALQYSEIALEKQHLRDSNYLLQLHNLSFEKYDYITSSNRKQRTNLQEVSNHLDTYFLTSKLRQACYALSREIIQQEQYEIKLIKEAIHYIETNQQFLKVPAIAIYFYCFKAIRSADNEHFFLKLREAISNYQHLFPTTEIRDIYTVAINFSIRKINSGSPIFAIEAFELYILSLEQGYLLEEGIMLESTFSNIVFLAARLKKYDWAKEFIQQYKSNLKPAYQKPLYHFSLGKLFYEQGQLKESLQQLIQVETKASFLLLGARVLQLKIYYELEEFEPLENLLESLRVYLHRSKDLGYRRAHYEYILKFTKQLLQLPIMNSKDKIKLKDRIKAAKIFTEKEWFLKQINT